MAGDTVITIVGNLVEDPNLRFTSQGQAVASFRIASTPRTFDRQSGEWKDGEALFLTCSVWRQYAENVAETLQRGMRVIVQGRLKQRSYETREGEKRVSIELDVEEVGPALRYATAKVNRTQRQGGGFGGGGQQGGGFGDGGQQGGGGFGDGQQSGGFGGGQQSGGFGGGGGQQGGGFGGGGQQGGSQPNDPWDTGSGGGGGGGGQQGGGYSEDPPF